ncbi:MAG TPA: amino acid adenylation domain-containing protein, partial [Ktedonobacteraceae bacterium]|nr:amino acid adenylation domain-containing protein [Ktedonobacteraceae bacterium]
MLPSYLSIDNVLEDTPIQGLFEAQVERTPDAVAVVSRESFLTYWELDQQATRLAWHLRQLGVGPEVLVGLCLQRSLNLIVGVLAIFKAGGAYVPLDPRYPQARLSWILRDSQVALILTQETLREQLADANPQVQLLYLEHDQPVSLKNGLIESVLPLSDNVIHAENLAYVIYTSGSTGRPKGVAIAQRSAAALLRWAGGLFGPAQRSGVLASTSICFDLSVFELWLPLCNGGTVILADDALQLPSLPAAGRITLLNTVPSVLTELLRISVLPASIKTVTLAGEPLPAALVRQLYASGSIEQVYNLYGPTEDTTYSTWVLAERKPEKFVPIGQSVIGTQTYVLDTMLKPVAIGTTGELYLGGMGLARGYLGRPDLTAERFIPDPFGGKPGTRLYRTGDIVRLLPDGSLEFIGRHDEQIKLRGFRIELGEIESILHEHPFVREAAVILREDRPGDKRLVAYVGASQDRPLAPGDLQSWLAIRLPDYMIPSMFVLLDRLPLTSNGKVDRQALPVPDTSREALEVDYAAPHTPLEEVLVTIWSQVLGLKLIGVHDNFFALGGHSLLATQVVARVRDILHRELPLQCLFEAPSVAELASLLEKADQNQQEQPLALIRQPLQSGPAPLSFPQERVWFIQQLHANTRAYHFQATLRFRGHLDLKALFQSLNEIIHRHEIMRSTFPALNGEPVQQVHPSFHAHLPLIDLADLSTEESILEEQRILGQELHKTFDLTQLPLVRWLLLRLNPKEHLLIHVEHHLIHDGWSFNVFLRELFELYRSFSSGGPSPLPQLPIQFADFARWQRQWMQGEVAEAQLAYWRNKLADSSPTLLLPTDYPRPAVQSLQGAALRIELPLELCEELRTLSRREGATLFMTMLAIFFALLKRYSGQDDISIGTGIANRRWRETESLIGMIINTLVLRTRLSSELTFRELLKQVREVTLEAYAHQDLPFERVVEVMQPERKLSQNPLFQVVFAFHDSPLPELEWPGMEVELLEAINNGSAKFDLNLTVIPRSEQRVGQGSSRVLPGGITMIWEYSTDLFEEDTISRMIEHYQTLAKHVVMEPWRSIGELPLLSQAEQEQLLRTWNPPAAPLELPAGGVGVHEHFAAQARHTPDAIA